MISIPRSNSGLIFIKRNLQQPSFVEMRDRPPRNYQNYHIISINRPTQSTLFETERSINRSPPRSS